MMSANDQMAAQLAELLTASDGAELEEVVRRWKETAVTPRQRRSMDEMGEQILAIRAALESAPKKPTREELETALRMMFRLATSGGSGGS